MQKNVKFFENRIFKKISQPIFFSKCLKKHKITIFEERMGL
jgi:hypothetical protein